MIVVDNGARLAVAFIRGSVVDFFLEAPTQASMIQLSARAPHPAARVSFW
jgi:hypothetical protein